MYTLIKKIYIYIYIYILVDPLPGVETNVYWFPALLVAWLLVYWFLYVFLYPPPCCCTLGVCEFCPKGQLCHYAAMVDYFFVF